MEALDNEVDYLVNKTNLKNPNYTILVEKYLFNQYRIRITDKRTPDSDAPLGHGEIVQEFCTYKKDKMLTVVEDWDGFNNIRGNSSIFLNPVRIYKCNNTKIMMVIVLEVCFRFLILGI